MSRVKVLVIASHHDDETLGLGATIAKLSQKCHEVYVLVLGEGPVARPGTDAITAIRNHKSALTHLGAKPYQRAPRWPEAELPDNLFDTIGALYITRRISMALADIEPEAVYTHHPGDLNQDHRAVAKATLIATRPYGSTVKTVYAYEVPSSTEWAYHSEAPFRPDVYEQITPKQLERKIQAMELYESERRTYPHPRSPEVLRAKAIVRGSEAGVPLAEAFELVRWMK